MEEIIDRKDCCGCAACYATCIHGAISMIEDASGFLYPRINQKTCVDCGLCKSACPIIKRDSDSFIVEGQEFYACHNNDEEEWKASSSGGIFRILADYIVNMGGYVAGAVYDDHMVVRHILTNHREDLEKFRGSKYVQSDTREVYKYVKERLNSGLWVLYTGTPCQVEALKNYLRKPFEKLLTCDIICTSVPSPKVFRDYVEFLEKRNSSKVVSVNMKDKTKGWPFAKTRVLFSDGKSIYDTLDADLWIKAWSTELMNRPSCECCRFTNYNRPGDITIGDCWSVFHKKNAFSSPNGISQLMINTPKGHQLFKEIKEKMTLIPITKEFAWQSKLEYPIKNNEKAPEFWNDYQKMNFVDIAQKYFDYSSFKYYKNKYLPMLLSMLAIALHKLFRKCI